MPRPLILALLVSTAWSCEGMEWPAAEQPIVEPAVVAPVADGRYGDRMDAVRSVVEALPDAAERLRYFQELDAIEIQLADADDPQQELAIEPRLVKLEIELGVKAAEQPADEDPDPGIRDEAVQ